MATGIIDLPGLAGEFDPLETTYALSTTTPTQIAKLDPTRWALLIYWCSGTSSANWSTKPTVSASSGVNISATAGNVILYFNQVGGLVQGEFWAKGGAAAQFLTVIEVRLRPHEDQP